VKLW